MVKHAVILEDDDNLREVFEEWLSLIYSIRVTSFNSFHSMIEREADVIGCDVAFLDIYLGPRNPTGIEAYHWLKEKGFNGKIVFFTGHGRFDPLVQRAMKLYGVEILTKPARFEDLEKIVKGNENGKES